MNEKIENTILDLPDYISGRLSPQRREEIDAMLEKSAELQEELMHAKEFQSLYQEANSARFNAMFEATVEDRAKEETKSSTSFNEIASGWLAKFDQLFYGGNVWKPAFMVAASFLSLNLLSGNLPQGESDQSLSGDHEVIIEADLLVQFLQDASFCSILKLLKDENLTIVEGPEGNNLKLSFIDDLIENYIQKSQGRLENSDLIIVALPIGKSE